ncbi:MAG: hypothetical protein QM743_12025 [Chitinophagaceae bacterium]
MKKLLTIFFAVLFVSISNISEAAFPVKQPVSAQAANDPAQAATLTAAPAPAVTEMQKTMHTKKAKRTADTIPVVLYVILAIFWLGWLAMGINDDFEGYDWLISLLLYILFYLPGLIFTLIKMGKYY